MVLLRTRYMYGGFLEYYFKLQFSAFWSFGVCMIKLRHERMLILRCIFPKKTELPPEKKFTPWPPPEKISNTLTRNSGLWEYLNPMRNLKLLENISLPHPPPTKKKSESTRKRKNITLRKSFNHPKIASTIIKKPQKTHLKNSQFLKKP